MTDVDYPGAIPMWVPTSDLFTTNTHAAIVIHKTASGNTAQDIAQYFINNSPGPSVHYIVGLDGAIVQCAPENMGAGGNCCLEAGHDPFWDQFGGVNLNTVTLSIEHVDPASDNSTACPPAQIDASFKLVAYLCQKYGIPVDHIKTHSSLDPISRARCPGNYPFADLIAYVRGGTTSMPVPQGWTDQNNTLTAPNGVPIVYGFRQHILDANSWDSGNQPQEPEYHTDQVLLHNTSVGAGQRQVFRDNFLWYTPSAGVVQEPYMGLELDTAYQLIASQQGEIANLQTQLAQVSTPPPAVVDTTQIIADINAIGDGLAPLIARALVDIKKL